MNLKKIKNYLLNKKEEKTSFYNSDPQYVFLYKFAWDMTETVMSFFIKLTLFPIVMAFYLSNMKEIFFSTLDLKQIDINFVLNHPLTLPCSAMIILIGIRMILFPLNKGVNFIVSKIIKKIKGKDEADAIDNDDVLTLVKYLEKDEMRAFLKNKNKLTYSDVLLNIGKFEKFNNVKIKQSERSSSEKLEEYLDCLYAEKLNK